VHEELAAGLKFIRCRIETRNSWLSWIFLGVVTLACWLVVAILREAYPLIWFAFALVPLAAMAVAYEQFHQQAEVAAVIQLEAAYLGMKEFSADSPGPELKAKCGEGERSAVLQHG
jgi:hypothetical protein